MVKAQGIAYYKAQRLCLLLNIVLIRSPWSLCWIAEPKEGWGIWLRDNRPDPDPRGRKLHKVLTI